MDPEKKIETTQATAEVAVDPKAATGTPETKPEPIGLDRLTTDQLKEFYKKSPQMFEEAGIVPKREEKPPEKKVEEPPKPQSAAPVVMDGTEIKLPDDVQVDRAAVDAYLAHAKEIGLNAKQVQGEIDFQVRTAREQLKRQAEQNRQPTPQEQDAANVAKLKADKEFGANYEGNMELARRAAAKFADPELLEKLKTSDPVLVRHFWKIGKADAEDSTRGAPNRTGNESDETGQDAQTYLEKRYPNTRSAHRPNG